MSHVKWRSCDSSLPMLHKVYDGARGIVRKRVEYGIFSWFQLRYHQHNNYNAIVQYVIEMLSVICE